MCTECYDGYFLGSNKCKSCPSNCECNDQGDCVSCKKGYYDIFSKCDKPCPSNCLKCESVTVCSECKNGFYIGYEHDIETNIQQNTCQYICRESCTQCHSYNNCSQCTRGKYCSTCQEDCSVGSNDKTCLSISGHCSCTVDVTGDKCMKCVDGKYGFHCNKTCSKYCKGRICERTSGHCSDGCVNENMSGSICNTCVSGMFGERCDRICPENCKYGRCEKYSGKCSGPCDSSTGECFTRKEEEQQKDASKSSLIAATVLGSLFSLSFAVNIVLFAIFLLKRRKRIYTKHTRTEREPTYENQLNSVGEEFPRATPDAAEKPHYEAVERNVYEGISKANEMGHDYQQVAYVTGNRQ